LQIKNWCNDTRYCLVRDLQCFKCKEMKWVKDRCIECYVGDRTHNWESNLAYKLSILHKQTIVGRISLIFNNLELPYSVTITPCSYSNIPRFKHMESNLLKHIPCLPNKIILISKYSNLDNQGLESLTF
jgi:hypothetical protein